jgi:copper chaperone
MAMAVSFQTHAVITAPSGWSNDLLIASPRVIPWRGIGGRSEPMTEMTFSVPGMSCGHCKQTVSKELLAVDGVDSVDVDLETKLVVVHGSELDRPILRAAIEQAGYQAA